MLFLQQLQLLYQLQSSPVRRSTQPHQRKASHAYIYSHAPCSKHDTDLINKQLLPTTHTVLQQLQKSPSKALLLLTHLSTLPPSSLILHCPSLTSTLPFLLTPSVPRRIQALYLRLWTKVNTVIPRKYDELTFKIGIYLQLIVEIRHGSGWSKYSCIYA